MASAAPASAAPMVTMQGIAVPQASVNPTEFFRLTRRLTFQQKAGSFAGLGQTDNLSVLQTGIVSGLSIKFSGSLVVTPGSGAVATTARWPYDIAKSIRFSANGQSNLVNLSGLKLKVRDIMSRGVLTSRGVTRGIGGASPGTQVSQGTLSLSNESWGVGSNVTAIPAGTYPVELVWYIPAAFDEVTLTGAIFAQTSATDLNLAIDWALPTDLFVLTSNATAVLTGSINVAGRVFSIPEVGGAIVVPDLSIFHSLIQSRYTALANGDNEIRLVGQGVGRQLLRVYYQLWNNNPGAPVALNATNFGQQAWRFGGNDTPEIVADARHLAYFNERLFDDDIAGQWGFGCWDFAKEFSFRDSVDEGTATELRLLVNIANAVTLSTPAVEYVQETVFAGPTGA
jgi:hypothetical protein